MVGRIEINGLIGSFEGQKGVELIDVISQVRKQPDATEFEVHITSEGGIVDVGFDIYNYLKSLGLPITTIGNGLVASIATVIFMAGNRRVVKPNTRFMIHLPMGGIEYATADEMEMHTKTLRSVESRVIDFYSKELGIGKEAVTPLLRNETWLNEQQLFDLGFVTSNSEMQIAAIYNKSNKKEKMSNKSKLKKILNSLFGETKEQKTVAKIVYTADNKEINFPDLGEDDAILVGSKATIDGKPAEGEVTSADGTRYIFEGGFVKEIREADDDIEEEISNEEMIDALLASLVMLDELNNEVENLKKEFIASTSKNEELDKELKKAKEIINKLKGASSEEPEDEKKDKQKDNKNISNVIAQWRARKKVKK